MPQGTSTYLEELQSTKKYLKDLKVLRSTSKYPEPAHTFCKMQWRSIGIISLKGELTKRSFNTPKLVKNQVTSPLKKKLNLIFEANLPIFLNPFYPQHSRAICQYYRHCHSQRSLRQCDCKCKKTKRLNEETREILHKELELLSQTGSDHLWGPSGQSILLLILTIKYDTYQNCP